MHGAMCEEGSLARALLLLLLTPTQTIPSGGRGGACAGNYGNNCYASRRCCDASASCYTKYTGKRYAQCRPNGCVGTCGWECRLLRPGARDSDAPEYGEGAQNASQAVAALRLSMPQPAAGERPHGKSERLGNVIDSWYFASLGSQPRVASLLAMACGAELSFGRFLAGQLGRVTVGAEQAAAALEESSKHDSWGM